MLIFFCFTPDSTVFPYTPYAILYIHKPKRLVLSILPSKLLFPGFLPQNYNPAYILYPAPAP